MTVDDPDAEMPPESRGSETGANPSETGTAAALADVVSNIEKDSITTICLMNTYYHGSREAFLDNVHRWFMFAVIILGAAAVVDIFPQEHKEWLKASSSACAAVIAALDLTFDLSNRARMHSMLRKRYFDLLSEFNESKKNCSQVRSALNNIYGDEEPQFRVLLACCWNSAQQTVYGDKAKHLRVNWYNSITKNLVRRSSVKLVLEGDK